MIIGQEEGDTSPAHKDIHSTNFKTLPLCIPQNNKNLSNHG